MKITKVDNAAKEITLYNLPEAKQKNYDHTGENIRLRLGTESMFKPI